jgi:U3 small nucleolar RNA-associated protein 21
MPSNQQLLRNPRPKETDSTLFLQIFSSDSRWLITTSLDSIIRTFDIPTGRLVDAFRTTSIATSLTFSPTGDFLATAHVDSLGVHLWANRAQFSDVALRHIDEDEEMPEVGLPTILGEDEANGESTRTRTLSLQLATW